VRAFTPDVESALRWFAWTHAVVVVPMVGARYARVSWPHAGGAGDQDAWLTDALEYLRLVHDAMLREHVATKKKEPKTKDRRGR
jgi:hypothetical protein